MDEAKELIQSYLKSFIKDHNIDEQSISLLKEHIRDMLDSKGLIRANVEVEQDPKDTKSVIVKVLLP